MVTDPDPAVCPTTAVELIPVVDTLGQPPISIEPVAPNAVAMIPALLTVLIAPVLTVTFPAGAKACAATPYPPGVVPPLVEVVMLPVVTETVPPLARMPRSPVETLPTTIVFVPVFDAAVRSPRPVAVMSPATILMSPV